VNYEKKKGRGGLHGSWQDDFLRVFIAVSPKWGNNDEFISSGERAVLGGGEIKTVVEAGGRKTKSQSNGWTRWV